jgi:hypothetical protein
MIFMSAAHCGQRVIVAAGDTLGEVNIRMCDPSESVRVLIKQNLVASSCLPCETFGTSTLGT